MLCEKELNAFGEKYQLVSICAVLAGSHGSKSFTIFGFFKSLPSPNQALVFTCLHYKSFENTVGTGEIARNEQFLLFPQCFLSVGELCHFHQMSNLSSANSFSLEESKICRLGKG